MILSCVIGWSLLLHTPARGAQDDGRLAALVTQLQDSSNCASSSAAFMELSKTLSTGPAETVAAAQTLLCQALRASDNAWAVRRIAMVLSAAPCEDTLVVLAGRLGSNPPEAMCMALCGGLQAVAGKRPPISPATVTLALGQLEAVARNGRLPGPVVESAVLATAAFGSAGFDQLIKLKLDAKAPGKVQNVMYTALSETDDPRAIAVLCEAVTDPNSYDSRRAQAMHGLGQVFSRAASAGRAIDPGDRDTCVKLLQMHLGDATPDRVFASALKALARIVDVQQDAGLQQTVLNALGSASPSRREAALEALYRHNGLLDPGVRAAVRGLAQSDGNPGVRSTAASVLDKEQVFQTAPLSDAN
jgi:HEAT repeat protein